MRTKIQVIILTTAVLAGMGIVAVFGQTADEHSKMSVPKMSHDQAMAAMDKLSIYDKADMVDKMSVKNKAAAKKWPAGHDMSKMSAQDKAEMFDRMSMDMRITAIMNRASATHNGGMADKTGKTGEADK